MAGDGREKSRVCPEFSNLGASGQGDPCKLSKVFRAEMKILKEGWVIQAFLKTGSNFGKDEVANDSHSSDCACGSNTSS